MVFILVLLHDVDSDFNAQPLRAHVHLKLVCVKRNAKNERESFIDARLRQRK